LGVLIYDSEATLVRDFVDAVRRASTEPLASTAVGEEFDFRSGRTDVVTLSTAGDLHAFEVKLSRWREALHQAYRATSFANRSYVVLPPEVALRAARFPDEFSARQVGICTLRGGELEVICEAPRVDPLQPWLAKRAVAHIQSQAE
jgi:hypothetical protein